MKMPKYNVHYQFNEPKEGNALIEAWCWEAAKRIFQQKNKRCKVLSIRKMKTAKHLIEIENNLPTDRA